MAVCLVIARCPGCATSIQRPDIPPSGARVAPRTSCRIPQSGFDPRHLRVMAAARSACPGCGGECGGRFCCALSTYHAVLIGKGCACLARRRPGGRLRLCLRPLTAALRSGRPVPGNPIRFRTEADHVAAFSFLLLCRRLFAASSRCCRELPSGRAWRGVAGGARVLASQLRGTEMLSSSQAAKLRLTPQQFVPAESSLIPGALLHGGLLRFAASIHIPG